MTINKFQGKTESEAIEKAKKEMGPDVVIMSVKTVKPKGMFRAFKGIAYEVTAALEENELDKMSTQAIAEARESQAQLQAQKPESWRQMKKSRFRPWLLLPRHLLPRRSALARQRKWF